MDILFPFENNELDLNLFISYLITNKDLFKNEYHDEYEIFNKIKSKLSIISNINELNNSESESEINYFFIENKKNVKNIFKEENIYKKINFLKFKEQFKVDITRSKLYINYKKKIINTKNTTKNKYIIDEMLSLIYNEIKEIKNLSIIEDKIKSILDIIPYNIKDRPETTLKILENSIISKKNDKKKMIN